jgi:hypothetical protein
MYRVIGKAYFRWSRSKTVGGSRPCKQLRQTLWMLLKFMFHLTQLQSLFQSLLYYSHHMFRLVYRPSSGVIYKHNISRSNRMQNPRIKIFECCCTHYFVYIFCRPCFCVKWISTDLRDFSISLFKMAMADLTRRSGYRRLVQKHSTARKTGTDIGWISLSKQRLSKIV